MGETEGNFHVFKDGHTYGHLFPDFCIYLCSHASAYKNGHFLVDGYNVLDALAADPITAWVPSALELKAVSQTGCSTDAVQMVIRAPCGRRALRCQLPEATEAKYLE